MDQFSKQLKCYACIQYQPCSWHLNFVLKNYLSSYQVHMNLEKNLTYADMLCWDECTLASVETAKPSTLEVYISFGIISLNLDEKMGPNIIHIFFWNFFFVRREEANGKMKEFKYANMKPIEKENRVTYNPIEIMLRVNKL